MRGRGRFRTTTWGTWGTWGAALLLALPLSAQQGGIPVVPEADPADVETLDGIITALYASISGPMGEARDFERFRSLFAPHGKLIPTSANSPTGYLYWTPEEYWERALESLTAMGFTEAEIARTTEQFGRVTHVFSTYESFREDQGDPDTAFARGINSIQLVRHQDRWWVLSITWDSERPGNEIPGRYLGGPGE